MLTVATLLLGLMLTPPTSPPIPLSFLTPSFPMNIIPKRMTARMQEPFCLFLIGMRINRPLKIQKWLPVFSAMPRMMQELYRHPELGFISGNFWFGRTTIAVQYWKSFEALTRYAKQPDLTHLPAWAQFRRNIGNSGDVGIWHETYLIA